VLLVDDHQVVRDGLKTIIREQGVVTARPAESDPSPRRGITVMIGAWLEASAEARVAGPEPRWP